MRATSRWEFTSITRMFWTSENTQLRLLSFFFKSNAKIAKIVRELLSVQCSWEDFRHVLSNELSKWLKLHSRRITCKKLYFVIYFLCCRRWKCKFLNKLKRSLVTLGEIIIFSPRMRQVGSGWNAGRLLQDVVYNYYSDAQVFETFECAKCFGVFFVNFCATKVKGTTNILTSALRYCQLTGNRTIL